MKEINVTEEFIEEMNQYKEADKSKSLFENCSDSPVIFAKYMLGLELYAWQVYFLKRIMKSFDNNDTNKEFVAITSRQIGKSTVLAVFSLWCVIFNKYPGTISNNTSVGIASASDTQAKKLLYEMKKLLRIGDTIMFKEFKKEDFFTQLLDDKEPNNTTTITFKPYQEHFGLLLKESNNGSVIKSYPPTSGVLGETFSVVIIDEAGKTDKITDEFFYDYMYPTGNSTDAIRIYTSTPWVPSGFFYRMVDPDNLYGNTPADCVVFTVEAIKIENPKYYKVIQKIIKQLNEDGKIDEVQRAYYCRFIKGEKSYFDPEKIFQAFLDYKQVNEYSKPCDLGVDFGGQTISRTVLTVTEATEDGCVRRLYHKTFGVGEDNNLVSVIEELKTRFNIQRIIPDDCPQGDYLIRQMQEKGWEVHPMNFRAEKVKKYGAFRSLLNKGKIQTYQDDELKTEMLALEFAEGRRQSVIQHASGYTDDLIDSFLMSCYFSLETNKGVKFFDLEEDTNVCSHCKSERVIIKEVRGKVFLECLDCGYVGETHVYD